MLAHLREFYRLPKHSEIGVTVPAGIEGSGRPNGGCVKYPSQVAILKHSLNMYTLLFPSLGCIALRLHRHQISDAHEWSSVVGSHFRSK